MLDNVAGVKSVYRLQGDKLVKVSGEDIQINPDKLRNILLENMRIGEEEAKELKFLGSLRGFAMILDDLGIVFINDYLILTDAKKTNWDLLIKATLKGMVMQNG
ncbi:MAG: hypothetical protein QXH75_06020 [Sulfolobaceae archaeon]